MEVKGVKRSIDFMPQIEGLRFVAVTSVVIGHWVSQDFSNSFILSNIPFTHGVNLFFVISGFLITYILLNKKDEISEKKTSFWEAIKNFYVKRTLRIFPIYYILIILLCVFSYDSIKDYVIYLFTYSINWYMVIKGDYIGTQGHLWSLAVEEQFYLIWPCLIFLVSKKWTLRFIVISILFSFVSKCYFMYYTGYWMGVNGATFSCFDSLGLGALIAYSQKNRTMPFKPKLYKIGLVVSILIYTALFVYPGYLSQSIRSLLWNFATSVVFFFVVIIAANRGFTGLYKSFLENKVVLYLGRISYGMYLYFAFVPQIYFAYIRAFFPSFKGDADLFIMFFILNVLLATISWYLIEKPLLSLKRYFQ